jgi:RNA polymerase sigma factor (sigma-70 family)
MNCNEKSEETCHVCKEARAFLERDDKRQASKERTHRNHIIHIDLSYAEDKKLIVKQRKDVLEHIVDDVDNKKIWEVFNSLTKLQCRRFTSYYIDGKTLEEIGREEGVEYQTIQKSLNKSRKKLKKFLQRGV